MKVIATQDFEREQPLILFHGTSAFLRTKIMDTKTFPVGTKFYNDKGGAGQASLAISPLPILMRVQVDPSLVKQEGDAYVAVAPVPVNEVPDMSHWERHKNQKPRQTIEKRVEIAKKWWLGKKVRPRFADGPFLKCIDVFAVGPPSGMFATFWLVLDDPNHVYGERPDGPKNTSTLHVETKQQIEIAQENKLP